LTINLPDWIYHLLNGVALIAALGLFARLVRWFAGPDFTAFKRPQKLINRIWPFTWQDLTAARALAWAWPAAVFVSWIRWATVTWSSQGRLIFSAIPMWSLGLAWGLSYWMPDRRKQWAKCVPAGLSAGLLALTLISLPLWILPVYASPTLTQIPNPEKHDMQPLEVSYGEALRLLGYKVETERARPGKPLKFRLLWQVIAPTSAPHSTFIHVLGEEGRIVAQRDAFPGRGLMSTTRLKPGQAWVEAYATSIPITAYTPDTLTLQVGVYDTATGARLPVAEAGITGPDVTFGSIAMPARNAHVPNPITVRFGRGIVLRGYELSTLSVKPGGVMDITLYWECESSVEDNFTVSVQLIDSQWRKASQSDGWPRNGTAPTSTWQPGQRITEQRQMEIASDAVPNAYDLQIALYQINESGELIHLPVTWQEAQMPVQSVTLTRIRVR
jgi:hypothetical protein